MTIIAPAPESPSHDSIDDRFIMQTPRPRMMKFILETLLRHEPVRLGDTHFRFCKRGDTFDDGDTRYEALYTGIYQRFGVWQDANALEGSPHHFTWCYVTDLGSFDDIINPVLVQLSAYQRECAMLDITVPRVMQEMRRARTSPAPSAKDLS
jgi:hypothetical protein